MGARKSEHSDAYGRRGARERTGTAEGEVSTAKRERRRRANGPTRGARASRQRTNELARSLLVHLEVAVQLWLDLDDARQEVVDDALAAVGERVLDAGERLVGRLLDLGRRGRAVARVLRGVSGWGFVSGEARWRERGGEGRGRRTASSKSWNSLSFFARRASISLLASPRASLRRWLRSGGHGV